MSLDTINPFVIPTGSITDPVAREAIRQLSRALHDALVELKSLDAAVTALTTRVEVLEDAT